MIGLLDEHADSRALLNIDIRNPSVDVTQGTPLPLRRAEQALTAMAANAVAGNWGVTVEPYHHYCGVPVVGAWKWLNEYGMGVTTEVDNEEAFRPLTILQWIFTGLYVLLRASSVVIFVFTLVVRRMTKEAQKAAVEARQLGQSEREDKRGAGGMEVVSKAHHAMLRRPTAVKMLSLDKVDAASTARFEWEVQITRQLNHPNSIAIYDYGRTPEGVFYDAMEFLDGLDLQQRGENTGRSRKVV